METLDSPERAKDIYDALEKVGVTGFMGVFLHQDYVCRIIHKMPANAAEGALASLADGIDKSEKEKLNEYKFSK